MEDREKWRIVSGGLILVTLCALVLLSTLGIFPLDRSWPVLILAFALSTLLQSPRDLGGWVIGAAGVLFLFLENWFGQIGDTGMNLLRSALLVAIVFAYVKFVRKKA